MNLFEEWKNEMEEDEEKALFKRTIEIKKLMSYDQPKAVETRERAQINQKRIQDNRSQITERPLDIGEIVFIKDLRLVKQKLDSKFNGPFTIYGRSPLGNYWLVDKDNKKLEQTYPRSKLKVAHGFINDNEARFAEETLQRDDQNDEQEEQNVEQLDRQNEEQVDEQNEEQKTSEIEENEETCAAIHCKEPRGIVNWVQCDNCDRWYHQMCTKWLKGEFKCQSCKIKETKERKKGLTTNKSLNCLALIFLLTLFSVFDESVSIIINDNFKYCDTNENSVSFNPISVCNYHKENFIVTGKEYTLIEKRKYEISGYGHYCKMIKHTTKTWCKWHGSTEKSREEEIIQLSRSVFSFNNFKKL